MTLAMSQVASERSMPIFLLLKIAQKSRKNKRNNWDQGAEPGRAHAFLARHFRIRTGMALKKSLDILILTVECWATKRCCPIYMTT